jgi:hypothetical protein
VEIGAEAALFPEKEYISGIFVAVYLALSPAPALLPPSCFEDVKTTRLLQLQDGAGDRYPVGRACTINHVTNTILTRESILQKIPQKTNKRRAGFTILAASEHFEMKHNYLLRSNLHLGNFKIYNSRS